MKVTPGDLDETERRAKIEAAPLPGMSSARRLLELISEARRLLALLPQGYHRQVATRVAREKRTIPSEAVQAKACGPGNWRCRGCGNVKPREQVRKWNRLCFTCMPSVPQRRAKRLGQP